MNTQLTEGLKSAGMIGVITRPAIVATILFGVWRALGRCSSSKLLGGRESLGFVSWRLGVRAFDHTQTMRQCDHPGSSGSAEKEQGSAEPARVGRSAGEESLCPCGPQKPRTAVFQINVTLLHPRISRLGLVFSLRNIADCKEVQSVQNFGEIQVHEGLRKRVYIGRVACRLGVNSCQTLAAAKLKASS